MEECITNGKAFTKEKWVEICVQYFQLQAELGDYPTVEQLAKNSMISIDYSLGWLICSR